MEEFAYNLEHYLHEIDSTSRHTEVSEDISVRIDIIRQISSGLAYIHDHHEMHGGMKPTNGVTLWKPMKLIQVLYCSRDSQWKLTDIGFIPGDTSTRSIAGKKSTQIGVYSAPEIIIERSKYSQKADIWSLGCIVFEIAIAKMAFRDLKELVIYTNSTTAAIGLTLINYTVGRELLFAENLDSFIKNATRMDPDLRPTVQSFLETLEWGAGLYWISMKEVISD